MKLYNWNNCPPTVSRQVSAVEVLCRHYLKDSFIGMYIHGSLSLGQFNEKISDIDIIVVVSSPIPINERYSIIKELLLISNQPHAIEISYITKEVLDNWVYPPLFELHYSEGWRERCSQAISKDDTSMWENTYNDPELACHLTLVKRNGIHIHGESIDNLIPNIPEHHFISSIISDSHLSLPQIYENPVYAILTPWRIIAYLDTKQILSKVQAGKWAMEAYLDEHLSQLVKQAIDYYETDNATEFNLSDELLNTYIGKVHQVLKAYIQ